MTIGSLQTVVIQIMKMFVVTYVDLVILSISNLNSGFHFIRKFRRAFIVEGKKNKHWTDQT